MICELVEMIQQIIGFEGHVQWDSTKPDGTMKKVLDISRLQNLGWNPRISLQEGIQKTYECYGQVLSRETMVKATAL